jgi:hypothetical protein
MFASYKSLRGPDAGRDIAVTAEHTVCAASTKYNGLNGTLNPVRVSV